MDETISDSGFQPQVVQMTQIRRKL
jgi:hypothetical protein